MSEIVSIVVDFEDKEKRLDTFVSEKIEESSRSNIQKLIKEKLVEVNGKIEKPSYKICEGDRIVLELPEAKELNVEPQDIPIDIVYEDEDILVVNKKQGMVVHPAPGNIDGTLVNAILFHCKDLSTINGVIRPGIVHRIDKNTSGLLVIAKNDKSHNFLAEQFALHSITREYEMIAVGNVNWEKMTVDKPIGRNPKDRLKMAVVKSGGKRAVTHFEVIQNFHGFMHLRATLETGRTHQIRVHLNFLNHPILGDDLYGYHIKKFSKLEGQILHARKLGFIHPSKNEYMEFTSELPDYFKKVIEVIK